MKNKNIIPPALFFFIMQFFICINGRAQDYSRVVDKADTVNFSVPKNNGWQLLNSYVEISKTKDSVILELIILSDKRNIDWKNEQYIGKIKQNKFFSKTDRIALCYLLNDVYKVKVESTGKCYFILEKGNPPSGVPVVIPLKVSYRL